MIRGLWERRGPSAERPLGKQCPRVRTRLRLEREKEGKVQRQLADRRVLPRIDNELQRAVGDGFQELGGAADGVE